VITILIILFGGGTIFWLLYWMVVRPYLLDSVRADLYELRANLDWAIIENQPGSQTESAVQLARYLSESRGLRSASISPAIFLQMTRKSEVQAYVEKHRAIVNASPAWLRSLWEQSGHLSLKASLSNSPFLWMPLALVFLAAVFSYKIAEWWKQTEETAASLSCQHPA
jgi:hypothetical protein